MSQLAFDESIAKQLDVAYRTRDMRRRRELARTALGAQPGERILDVGCGPGFYVAELLDEVGAEGSVVGIDSSAQMLAVAARRCEGHANASFAEGDASSLPVEDASFDAALIVQVLEYVQEPGPALAELHRVLRPGGRVLVWDVDWATVSWHSSDPDRMARMLRAWDVHLAHPSLPQTLATRMRAAGFDDVHVEGHVFATTDLTPDSYLGALFPMVEDFVLGTGDVGEDEARAWGAEQRELSERGELFFTCTQFCFTATRA